MPLKHLFMWQERLVLLIFNVWDIGLGNIAKNMTSNMTILDSFIYLYIYTLILEGHRNGQKDHNFRHTVILACRPVRNV